MRGRWSSCAVAMLVLTQLLLPRTVATLAWFGHPPQSARHVCVVRPRAELTRTGQPDAGFVLLTEHFATTCRRTVRAFYEHPAPFGPVTEVGRAVRRHHSTSVVFSRDPAYCRFGWQFRHHHRWWVVVLRSHGSC